jgi:hypothetical protein
MIGLVARWNGRTMKNRPVVVRLGSVSAFRDGEMLRFNGPVA